MALGGALGGAGTIVLAVETRTVALGGGHFIPGMKVNAAPLPLVPFQVGALRTMPAAHLPEAATNTAVVGGLHGGVLVRVGLRGKANLLADGGREFGGGVRVRGAHGAGCTEVTFFTFFCSFLTF